ncbi:MAG: heparinase II/III family protein, partial [Gemmatimonadota bacterium]|nr:heparinase II/III family protein [Gemmatimonadota bacterium]
MTELGRTLRRLPGRSPRELLGRLAQLGRAEIERLGFGGTDRSVEPACLMSELGYASEMEGAADLLARFKARAETGPFSVFHDPARSLDVLQTRWPEAADRVLRRAERIESGRFDLLGYEALDFGDPVDWHLDPVHGVRAPLVHWSRVPYLDVEAVGDHKVIWELNRHQYLVDLGRAYWLSGDERWARLFAAHVGSWMEANPPKRGINWASSLELGLRSIAWLWALQFFLDSPSLTPALFGRLVAWLRLQGAHVERFVSTWFSPNTHLTGEALALVYLGELLPELPEASRWREKGRAWMREALRKQVRADGGYFEQSTHYGRYTADFYLHLSLLDGGATARGGEGGTMDRGRVVDLVDHLVALTRPDGRTPRIGDEDGGKLLFLDDRPLDDFRSRFLTPAALLGRGEWASVGGQPRAEHVWLLGPEAPDRLADLEA